MVLIENLKEILFYSLQYPDYARAEYLIKKQIESGWSKKTFLLALKELYEKYNTNLTLEKIQLEKENPGIKESDIGLSLENGSNGKINDVYVGNKKTKHLNSEVLELLLDTINQAWYFNEPEPQYTDLQIISFFENVIRFIKHEFELQAEIKEDDFPFVRPSPKGFTGKTENGEKIYLLHQYFIKWPKPILDFYTFKHALRNLLLNSQKPEKLSVMLKPIIGEVKEIIKIWNKTIQPLDSGIGKSVTYRRLIEFENDMANWTIFIDDNFPKFKRNAVRYTIYQFARFAYDTGSLVANEILDEKTNILKVKESDGKWNNSTFLLYYYNISQSEGNELSEGKVEQIAMEHNLNKTTLRRKHTELLAINYEPDEHTNSKTKFREDYEKILPQLKDNHPKAYTNVLAKLDILINSHKASKK